jgi:hypothetical protein
MKNKLYLINPEHVDKNTSNTIKYAFEKFSEVLDIPQIKFWRGVRDFSHFALNDHLLMVVLYKGFQWFVVGVVQKPKEVDLPKWDGGKYYARLQDGQTKILVGDEVKECSELGLTLSDGTSAQNVTHCYVRHEPKVVQLL